MDAVRRWRGLECLDETDNVSISWTVWRRNAKPLRIMWLHVHVASLSQILHSETAKQIILHRNFDLIFITGRLTTGHTSVCKLHRRSILKIFAPQGQHIAAIYCEIGVENPRTEHFTQFRNINAPHGCIHCSILTNFSAFANSSVFN